MSLDADFKHAAERMKKLKTSPSEDELLEIYALYKQAMLGDCDSPKPGLFDLKAKYKWEAWSKKKGMDMNTAKKQYIERAEELIKKYGLT